MLIPIAVIDPVHGHFSQNDTLAMVSLYHFTKSFLSSIYIYAFNTLPPAATARKANNPAPMAYGEFKWDVVYVSPAI